MIGVQTCALPISPAKQRFAGVFVLRRHASRRVRKAARCHDLGLTPDVARAAIKHTHGHASAVADATGAVHPGGVQPCHRLPQPTTRSSRADEHTYELQSLMHISYAVSGFKTKTNNKN